VTTKAAIAAVIPMRGMRRGRIHHILPQTGPRTSFSSWSITVTISIESRVMTVPDRPTRGVAMVRSGQVIFATCGIGLLLGLGGCAAPASWQDGGGGALIVRNNADGSVELTPDPAHRDRQAWLERRRQDDAIQREIYNWLSPAER